MLNNKKCIICGSEKVVALGKCKKCYQREYRQRPEYKEVQYARQRRYRQTPTAIERHKIYQRRYKQKPEISERLVEYEREYRARLRRIVDEHPFAFDRLPSTGALSILAKHEDELRNDPERLSVEFMADIIKDLEKTKRSTHSAKINSQSNPPLKRTGLAKACDLLMRKIKRGEK